MRNDTRSFHGKRSVVKRLAHGIFALCGLRISRVSSTKKQGSAKYFNTGDLTPLQENSRELYDRFYADHETLEYYYQGYRLDFYKAVSDQVKASRVLLDDRDVLDVGCGSGHLLEELRSWSQPHRMTGCDFSSEAVKFSCQRFPGYRFFQHDIYNPLLEMHDIIICTELLEHLERPWVALDNLVRAVRLGGVLVLTVPNGRRDTATEHLNFWSPESWKAFLEHEYPQLSIETTTLMDGRVNFALLRF